MSANEDDLSITTYVKPGDLDPVLYPTTALVWEHGKQLAADLIDSLATGVERDEITDAIEYTSAGVAGLASSQLGLVVLLAMEVDSLRRRLDEQLGAPQSPLDDRL